MIFLGETILQVRLSSGSVISDIVIINKFTDMGAEVGPKDDYRWPTKGTVDGVGS